MLKINKTRGKVVGVCAFMTVILGGVTSIPVLAATEGVTPVTYDNSVIVDVNDNGKWGVAIPAAISFTTDKKTVTTDIELVGINGTDLSTYKLVEITGKVKSSGSYKLKGPSTTEAEYELTVDGKKMNKDATEQEFTKKFGLGTPTTPAGSTALSGRLNVSAALTKEGKAKGRYSDILTFNFDGKAETK